jgi:hypothetical protein
MALPTRAVNRGYYFVEVNEFVLPFRARIVPGESVNFGELQQYLSTGMSRHA